MQMLGQQVSNAPNQQQQQQYMANLGMQQNSMGGMNAMQQSMQQGMQPGMQPNMQSQMQSQMMAMLAKRNPAMGNNMGNGRKKEGNNNTPPRPNLQQQMAAQYANAMYGQNQMAGNYGYGQNPYATQAAAAQYQQYAAAAQGYG